MFQFSSQQVLHKPGEMQRTTIDHNTEDFSAAGEFTANQKKTGLHFLPVENLLGLTNLKRSRHHFDKYLEFHMYFLHFLYELSLLI